MTDAIVILVIVAIVGAAIAKIVIEKKKGAKCIGCPSGGASSKHNCGCDNH
ncbi:FeoB-associated Cys-rich membrane protein [Desulfuribacillus stibiiarsenatis]|uniref:FeoB-associated Cys-rich membrane protein n=1 Tax=Desulfuribacillus stibiiarsenatis TaxID=1390249 RepID=UPI00114CAB0F|nr:FeoB-associated Cys-rich membrane protein [Desulfuribacillus stibiiarsenatis]